MSDKVKIGDRYFKGVHVVNHVDPAAGFCALMTYALNGVRRAVQDNLLPVVYFGKDATTHFYDVERGENVWDYYFEPVMGLSYAELCVMLDEEMLSSDYVHYDDPKTVIRDHQEDPERLATFWAVDTPENTAQWMANKRALGRRAVHEYVRVKPHIRQKVEGFHAAKMDQDYTVGVHIRGTDFAYAEPTAPGKYMKDIRNHVRDHGKDGFKIFLATDQCQYVECFEEAFPGCIITYDALRSGNDVAPYQKGEDVLVDTLLLSKCDYLFKCAAAGGEYAMWFAPSLTCTDYALQSRFDTRNFRRLTSAYLKLNIGRISSIKLGFHRAWRKVIRFLDIPGTMRRVLKSVHWHIDKRLHRGRAHRS